MPSLASNYTLLVCDHDGCELKPVNDNRRGLPSAATHLAEYFRPVVLLALLWLAGLVAYEWFVRIYAAIALAPWSKLT
jgi:hypothetical protein